jgi:hypothetical protein
MSLQHIIALPALLQPSASTWQQVGPAVPSHSLSSLPHRDGGGGGVLAAGLQSSGVGAPARDPLNFRGMGLHTSAFCGCC